MNIRNTPRSQNGMLFAPTLRLSVCSSALQHLYNNNSYNKVYLIVIFSCLIIVNSKYRKLFMAYSNKKKSPAEHAFRRMQADLKNNTLKNIMIFYGPEDYLIRWSVSKVKERYIQPAVEMFDFMRLDGTVCTADDIRTACETMPMMSEKRVVVVDDFNAGGQVRNPEDEASDEDEEETAGKNDELIEYFSDFPGNTVLIMISRTPDRRRKLFKSIQKYGADYDFDRLDVQQLKAFITKHLRSCGKEFDIDVPELMTEMSGYYDKNSEYTIDNLMNDISKVIAHSGEHITVQDVEETIAGNEERDVFAFTDALAAGRKSEAMSLLSTLLSYGEQEFKLLGLICAQFEVVLLVSEMYADGMTTSLMHEQTGIHEYRIKKSLPLARRYTVSRLRNILMRAYEVERNIKSGLMEPRTALELFVAMV